MRENVIRRHGTASSAPCSMIRKERSWRITELNGLESLLQQDGIFNVYTEDEVEKEIHTRPVTLSRWCIQPFNRISIHVFKGGLRRFRAELFNCIIDIFG